MEGVTDTRINILGEKGPAPDEVRVKGCAEQPCTIFQGTAVDAEVDFVARKIISFFV
jgi:hypothetical protein